MKKIQIFLLILIIVVASCAGNKKLAKVNIRNQETSDSVEYELITFDPGFETWYLKNSKPAWYHSGEYYEIWNRQYVTAWNAKVLDPRYNRYFDSTIEYDPGIHYGIELNHRLFYYFQYVEKALKIDILPPGAGPHAFL